MIRRLSVVGMPKCNGQGNASSPLLQPSLAALGTRCCRSQSNLLQDYHHRHHRRHHQQEQEQEQEQQQQNFVSIGRRSISTSAARGSPNKWSVDSDTGVVSLNGTPKFQTVIGVEIHAQLDISTKLFSGCPVPHSQRNTNTNTTNTNSTNARSALLQKPNSSVWPMDMGVPGILPRLSAEAVRAAVLSAGAIKCELPPVSRFERKHYFYADLPLGYQITQQRWPLARDGLLVCRAQQSSSQAKKKKTKKKKSAGGGGGGGGERNDDSVFALRIERVQLEQDTGKTLADAYTNPLTNQKESLVDFNRAGRALIEVVSHPDLRSSTQASIAVETLRSLFKHIGTCDGKMEEGSLRCDLNVSIAPVLVDDRDSDNNNNNNNNSSSSSSSSDDILSRTGHRVEVKNLNSIRQVQQAAEYEALRQARAVLEDDAPTPQETRTFDVKSNRTVVLRTKEGAKDYRFMPEPDLPPLVLLDALGETTTDGSSNGNGNGSSKSVEAFLEANLPELPDDARLRLTTDHGLSDYLAGVITNDPPAIAFFDEAVREAGTQLEPLGPGPKVTRKIPETVANLLCNELFGLVRELELQRLIEEGLLMVDASGGGIGGDSSVRFSRVNGQQLGEIVALVLEGSISNTMAKQLLRVLYNDAMEENDDHDHGDDHGDDNYDNHNDINDDNASSSKPLPLPLPSPSPRRVAKERGFELITDAGQLEALCREVIEDRPEELERYKLGGKYATKITKFLVGTAMAASRGNAHPERLAEVLAGVLEEVAPLGNPNNTNANKKDNGNGNGNGNGNSGR